MFCGNCGNIIPDGVSVCPRCGAPAADEFEDFEPGSADLRNRMYGASQPGGGYNDRYGMQGGDPNYNSAPVQNGFSGPQGAYVGHHVSSAGMGRTGDLSQFGNMGQTGDLSQFGNMGQTGDLSQFGNMGQTGNLGQFGSMGQTGDLRQFGNPGQTGDLRQFGNPGQTGSLGPDPYMGNYGGPAPSMRPEEEKDDDWGVEHRRTRKKGGLPVVPICIGAIVLILAAAAVLWLMLFRTSGDAEETDTGAAAASQEIIAAAETAAPAAVAVEEDAADTPAEDTSEADTEDAADAEDTEDAAANDIADADALYAAADGFEEDGTYVIVLEDEDGNFYAIANNDGQLETEEIEMDGDSFADDLAVQQNAAIRWTAEEPTDTRDYKVRFRLENSGLYLNVNADETALQLDENADPTRWYYSEDEGLNYLPGSDSEDADNTWVITDTDLDITTEGGLTVHIYTIEN